MYKVLIPVHIPITLYCIVLYYQEEAKREAQRQQGEQIESGEEELDESAAFETLRGLGLIATQEKEESVMDDIHVVQETRVL